MAELLKKSLIKVLKLKAGSAKVCIDIQYINRVLPLVAFEELPQAPAYCIGLMNIGGKSIPVIDLAMRLGLSRTKTYSLDLPILYCVNAQQGVGILVDKVMGLENIEKNKLQMRDEFNQPDSFFAGAISIKAELLLLVDMNKLLKMEFIAKNKADDKNINVELIKAQQASHE